MGNLFRQYWIPVLTSELLNEPGGMPRRIRLLGEDLVLFRTRRGQLGLVGAYCAHRLAPLFFGRIEEDGIRCPYHGWTYALDGALKGTPDFVGVCNFDRSAHGLVPIEIGVWEKWVLARVAGTGTALDDFVGSDLKARFLSQDIAGLQWMERRSYSVDCNWKVFVDNYLDGGYHVPHLHKGLDSVLDYSTYTIENGERFCLQSSPIVTDGAEARTGAVRTGDRAFYYWICSLTSMLARLRARACSETSEK